MAGKYNRFISIGGGSNSSGDSRVRRYSNKSEENDVSDEFFDELADDGKFIEELAEKSKTNRRISISGNSKNNVGGEGPSGSGMAQDGAIHSIGAFKNRPPPDKPGKTQMAKCLHEIDKLSKVIQRRKNRIQQEILVKEDLLANGSEDDDKNKVTSTSTTRLSPFGSRRVGNRSNSHERIFKHRSRSRSTDYRRRFGMSRGGRWQQSRSPPSRSRYNSRRRSRSPFASRSPTRKRHRTKSPPKQTFLEELAQKFAEQGKSINDLNISQLPKSTMENQQKHHPLQQQQQHQLQQHEIMHPQAMPLLPMQAQHGSQMPNAYENVQSMLYHNSHPHEMVSYPVMPQPPYPPTNVYQGQPQQHPLATYGNYVINPAAATLQQLPPPSTHHLQHQQPPLSNQPNTGSIKLALPNSPPKVVMPPPPTISGKDMKRVYSGSIVDEMQIVDEGPVLGPPLNKSHVINRCQDAITLLQGEENKVPTLRFLYTRTSTTPWTSSDAGNRSDNIENQSPLYSMNNVQFKLTSPDKIPVNTSYPFDYRTKDIIKTLGINFNHILYKLRRKDKPSDIKNTEIKEKNKDKLKSCHKMNQSIQTEENYKCNNCLETDEKIFLNKYAQTEQRKISIRTQTNEEDFRSPVIQSLAKLSPAQLIAVTDFSKILCEQDKPENTVDLFKLREKLMDIYNLSQRDYDSVKNAQRKHLQDMQLLDTFRQQSSRMDYFSNSNSNGNNSKINNKKKSNKNNESDILCNSMITIGGGNISGVNITTIMDERSLLDAEERLLIEERRLLEERRLAEERRLEEDMQLAEELRKQKEREHDLYIQQKRYEENLRKFERDNNRSPDSSDNNLDSDDRYVSSQFNRGNGRGPRRGGRSSSRSGVTRGNRFSPQERSANRGNSRFRN